MPPVRQRGRRPKSAAKIALGKTIRELTDDERRAWETARRAERRKSKRPRIAVFDTETDPFDHVSEILPFVGELWDGETSHVIWEETYEKFVEKCLEKFEALDPSQKWIVYAHNGGKFDWMYFVQKLRGRVSFKGRSLMSAELFPHVELRDSYHIIPDKLASYKKQEFDYKKLMRKHRKDHRAAILDYLHSDCVYLLEIIRHFIEKNGVKMSIGQAAWSSIKKIYPIESMGEASDAYIRQWFFGGRVECLQGPGIFEGDYVLEDVNAMYPDRMAHCEHPIGSEYSVRSAGRPRPNSRTVFLEVECDNFGALVGRGESGALTANIKRGTFQTTIWEFETALELDLIRNVRVKSCVDFFKRANLRDWVYPRYEGRQELKRLIDLGGNTDEYEKDSLIIKLEMNNGYGKGAQNPRKFREYLYTDLCTPPPGEKIGTLQYRDSDGGVWELELETQDFLVWKKPLPQERLRFNNVAFSASITGAARAKLLRKIHSVEDAIYCDTDSVICRRSPAMGNSNKLGEWKSEKLIDTAIILGKKLYGYRGPFKGKEVIRSKGGAGLSWHDMERMLRGDEVKRGNLAPTFDKGGFQYYNDRTFQLTCPRDYRSNLLAA